MGKDQYIQLTDATMKGYGFDVLRSEVGFSLERLFQVAGSEDRVITITFTDGSESYRLYGEMITGILSYTERERNTLQKRLEEGLEELGNARVKELLDKVPKELKAKLEREGFYSGDVCYIDIGPVMTPQNTYASHENRVINRMELLIDSEPAIEEIRIWYGFLKRIMSYGYHLTPDERKQYIALLFLFDERSASEEDKKEALNEAGQLADEEISRYYLLFKSKVIELNKEERKVRLQLETRHLARRKAILDKELKKIGSSLKKLEVDNKTIYEHILSKALEFKDKRLAHAVVYPIYLDYDGFLHISLRHVKEWQFNDFFKDRTPFQLYETDVIPTLEKVINEFIDEYQETKFVDSRAKFAKYGKDAIYINGDYYMIHVGENGNVENFCKIHDKNMRDPA